MTVYEERQGDDVVATAKNAKLGFCGFQSSGSGGVLVRLFPRSDRKVAMGRDAALHLLRLIERYNWALSEPEKRSDRWRAFWPVITGVERIVVAMFVSSVKGEFRGPVDLQELPPELAGAAGDRQLVKIDPAVAKEFSILRHVFIQTLVMPRELILHWWKMHPVVLEVHETVASATLQAWWDGGGEHDLEDLLRAALFSDGMRAEDATRAGAEMSFSADHLIQERESVLWGRE